MATAIPPLKDSEKIEIGYAHAEGEVTNNVADDVSSIVVASYNIRYAVGSYLISTGLLRKFGVIGDRDRERQVGFNLQTAAAAFTTGKLLPRVDVLALQEADKQTRRTGKHHVSRELAEALKLDWIHVPAGLPRGVKPKARQWWLDFEEPIDLHDAGDTGIGLLSRLPLSNVTRIDLPWHDCPWRPRLAMAATVTIGTRTLRIVNAHVDPHAAVGGQLEQLEALVEEADKNSGPTLILGDFNTLSKKKVVETRKFFEQHGYSTPFPSGIATWRGMGIRLHADWIFYSDLKISKWGVARPLNVSDHWPIWAEVVL